MKLSNHSNVPVYTISGSSSRTLPSWVEKKRRNHKKDPEYNTRVELLQDFEFEEASQCVRISDDGEWIMSTGTYKPQIHTHYLPHLSLSYARHTESLNTTFLLLSSDYSKSVHLQADRCIEFHTPQGCFYKTRIPRYGRDLKYAKRSAEVIVPSAGVNENGMGEAFRLNLELGRFMRGYEIEVGGDDETTKTLQGGVAAGSVNAAAVAEDSHNLLAFGTSLGTVELWDPRSRRRAGLLHAFPDGERHEVTCAEFRASGLEFAVGSSKGQIKLFDLRSPAPLLTKEQGYEFPIKNLIYITGQESMVLSADKSVIKIWDARDGTPWTSIEPEVDLNCVAWCRDSGMLLTANEGKQQHAFFIPKLGPAPKWCSFLDNVVEEMAEDPNDPNVYAKRGGEVYDDYKFVSQDQLEALGLAQMVGTTSLVRPYMHGFFVAQRLYDEARVISDPFVWEEQRAKRVRERIEKERESRIRGSKQVKVKVNKKLAERIADRERKPEGGLLNDPRFAKLFEDEAFAIDETSREFRLLNPSTKPDQPKLTAVEQEELDEVPQSSEEEEQLAPRMKLAKGKARDSSFGSRAAKTRDPQRTKSVVGEREISFVPAKKSEDRAPTKVKAKAGRRSASGNVLRYL